MYLLAYYGVWWLSHWPNPFNTLNYRRGSQRDKMSFPEEKQIILLFI